MIDGFQNDSRINTKFGSQQTTNAENTTNKVLDAFSCNIMNRTPFFFLLTFLPIFGMEMTFLRAIFKRSAYNIDMTIIGKKYTRTAAVV